MFTDPTSRFDRLHGTAGRKAGSPGHSAGFSLVEVALALGLMAFVLVSLFALVPMGINTSKQSLEESRGLNVLSAVRSDRMTTPFSEPSAIFGIPVLTNTLTSPVAGYFGVDDNCTSTGPNLQKARYRVDYRIVPPPAGQKAPFFGNFRVSWPAVAPRPEGLVEITATFPQP